MSGYLIVPSAYEEILLNHECGVGFASPEEIDRLNILKATFLSMKRALKNISIKPDYILVDGNLSPKFKIPHETIIKGDNISMSIAVLRCFVCVCSSCSLLQAFFKTANTGDARRETCLFIPMRKQSVCFQSDETHAVVVC